MPMVASLLRDTTTAGPEESPMIIAARGRPWMQPRPVRPAQPVGLVRAPACHASGTPVVASFGLDRWLRVKCK